MQPDGTKISLRQTPVGGGSAHIIIHTRCCSNYLLKPASTHCRITAAHTSTFDSSRYLLLIVVSLICELQHPVLLLPIANQYCTTTSPCSIHDTINRIPKTSNITISHSYTARETRVRTQQLLLQLKLQKLICNNWMSCVDCLQLQYAFYNKKQ